MIETSKRSPGTTERCSVTEWPRGEKQVTVWDSAKYYYEDLTTKDAINLIELLKQGKKPKTGSQHRETCEPAGVVHNDEWLPAPEGLETLTGEPRGPYCRDLAAVKAALEAKAKEEAAQKA